MTSNLKATLAFIFGGAAGAAAAWYVTKTYYETHIQEEIDSVKEAYGRKFTKVEYSNEMPEEPNEIKFAESEPQTTDIRREVDTHKVKYGQYAKVAAQYKTTAGSDTDAGIYPITDTEFGEEEGYSTMSLVWYTDEIMADWQDDEIIENVEMTTGYSWKKAFDKGEDTAYVRNEQRKCDYEILRSEKSYTEDVLPNKPPTLEERHDL